MRGLIKKDIFWHTPRAWICACNGGVRTFKHQVHHPPQAVISLPLTIHHSILLIHWQQSYDCTAHFSPFSPFSLLSRKGGGSQGELGEGPGVADFQRWWGCPEQSFVGWIWEFGSAKWPPDDAWHLGLSIYALTRSPKGRKIGLSVESCCFSGQICQNSDWCILRSWKSIQKVWPWHMYFNKGSGAKGSCTQNTCDPSSWRGMTLERLTSMQKMHFCVRKCL